MRASEPEFYDMVFRDRDMDDTDSLTFALYG